MDNQENSEIVVYTTVKQPIRFRALEKVFSHLRQRSVEQPYTASFLTIACELGLSRRTVIYALKTLQQQNRISCQKGIGSVNTYRIFCTSEVGEDTLPRTATTSPTYDLTPPPHSDLKEQIAEMYRRLSLQEFDDLLETMGETTLRTAAHRLAAAGGVAPEMRISFFIQQLRDHLEQDHLLLRLARGEVMAEY